MDRKAQCSLLLIPVSDTRRFRYFVGGFPGSRGDLLAFRSRSWYKNVEDPMLWHCILSRDEYILGDAGFALTPVLVRCCPFYSALVAVSHAKRTIGTVGGTLREAPRAWHMSRERTSVINYHIRSEQAPDTSTQHPCVELFLAPPFLAIHFLQCFFLPFPDYSVQGCRHLRPQCCVNAEVQPPTCKNAGCC